MREADKGTSRWRLTLALGTLLLLALVIAPASASAQGGTCEGAASATQDPAVASFNLECDEEFESFRIRSNEPGQLLEGPDVECTPDNNASSFQCEVDPADTLATGRFRAQDGDVCDDGRLELTFDQIEPDGGGQVVTVDIANCGSDDDDGGNVGTGPDEDSGRIPRGGVRSGAGGTAVNPAGEDRGGTADVLLGAGAVIVLALGLGLAVRAPRRA